jgi:aldose 1-epimerase
LEVTVEYRLADDDTLTLIYQAETSKATHVNLTNHVYFNLSGAGSGGVLDHLLAIAAERVLEFDERKIPTGKLLPTAGTPFDFKESRPIGEAIEEIGSGLDHCFALTEGKGVLLKDPASGRLLSVATSLPGVQVYTANHLKPTLKSPDGKPYGPHHGICFETQFFPDTPNQATFPSSLLRPGEKYVEMTMFRFATEK